MNKELKRELEEIAPRLANLPKEDIVAPEGYFESFEERLFAKIREDYTVGSKNFPLYPSKNNKLRYLAAAVVLFFAGLSVVLYIIKQEPSANNSATASASLEEVYLSEIDEESIIEYANTNTLTNTSSEIELYQPYLDEETIIEQL